VGWLDSYSLQVDQVSKWWREEVAEDWMELRQKAMEVLQEESKLQQLVQLVGPEALSDEQQWVLTSARLLREGFLQQNALHPVDAYAVPEKQLNMLRFFLQVHKRGRELLDEGTALDRIRKTFDMGELIRIRNEISNDEVDQIGQKQDEVLQNMNGLKKESE
jgi:V/A-type H+-transporting ATPase subunit A